MCLEDSLWGALSLADWLALVVSASLALLKLAPPLVGPLGGLPMWSPLVNSPLDARALASPNLSPKHISEPTRQAETSYADFCLKTKTGSGTFGAHNYACLRSQCSCS